MDSESFMPTNVGSNDQLSLMSEQMEEALAKLLEEQFALGMLAAKVLRPTRQQCTPASDALAAVVAAMRDAQKEAASTERKKLEALLRRSAAQLSKWYEWYGNADHSAHGQLPLPPFGGVELAEDISASLGLNK